MELFYITNDPQDAHIAEQAGVDRIFIDTEMLGKQERQKGKDTFLGNHTLQDIIGVKQVVDKTAVMVRINPLHSNTVNEIDQAITNGANWIMLPMFHSAHDVERVVRMIDGRTKFVGLIETAAAMVRLDDILQVSGIDEIHIGLNDLSIDLGLSFLFEPIAYGLIDWMADKLNNRRIPWGVGGIARIGGGLISAESILAEHTRLHSSRIILSRAFRRQEGEIDFDLTKEVHKLRETLLHLKSLSSNELNEMHLTTANQIKQLVLSQKGLSL